MTRSWPWAIEWPCIKACLKNNSFVSFPFDSKCTQSIFFQFQKTIISPSGKTMKKNNKPMAYLPYSLGLFLMLTGIVASCGPSQTEQTNEEPAETTTNNQMEPQEDNWQTLGLDQFRNFKSDGLNPQWVEQDGAIHLVEQGGGDIVTKEQFTNFALELEWKISEGGNSGIFFHVSEAEDLKYVWHSGPEYQVLDNERHADAKIDKHRAGDNYDLQAVSEETVKPAGEWNQTKLVVNQGNVEHWLNGKMVVNYQLGSPEWEEQYKNSKFKDMPMYGQAGTGHIALQDHGDKVWFRNVRIKKL
jgi:hypothetical protein